MSHVSLCTDLQLWLNVCDVSLRFLNKSNYMFQWQSLASQSRVIILLTHLASLFQETSETHRYTLGQIVKVDVDVSFRLPVL